MKACLLRAMTDKGLVSRGLTPEYRARIKPAWLQSDYNLTSSDVAELMGTSVRYSIAEVADRNVEIVAGFPKRILAMIQTGASPR